jgi:hypothetical protein
MSYRTKDVMISDFKNLCNKHSDFCRYWSIGKTVQNNDITVFVVGNNPDGRVCFQASTHSDERACAEMLWHYFKWLVESQDYYAIRLRRRNRTYFIPILNMDEYGVQRKNYNGVDLNRNFPQYWSSGGSTDPSAYDYRGTAPASEPETQVMIKFWEDEKPKWHFDIHLAGVGAPFASKSRGMSTEDINRVNAVWEEYKKLAAEMGQPSINLGTAVMAGYVCNEAYVKGAYGVIYEIVDTYTPPFEDIESVYYPRAKPMFIAVSESVGVEPPPVAPFSLTNMILLFSSSLFTLIWVNYATINMLKKLKE